MPAQSAGMSLPQARTGFVTHLTRHEQTGTPVPMPPSGIRLVKYPSRVGDLAAYVTEPRDTTKRYPAIIWIVGGFDNSIDDTFWTSASPDNDQSAVAFRKAGVVTMYPSLRGGNQNPGYKEGLYGEVEDIVSAAEWLYQQKYVDPTRIYLGGHSTGGTLALLTAETTPGFRAVFAFGPVADVRAYGAAKLPFDTTNKLEIVVRSPLYWLDSIHTPTFVFEGDQNPSNLDSLKLIGSKSHNSLLHTAVLPGATHFSSLARFTPVVAKKIVGDTGAKCNISFTEQDLQGR
jgi:dipeptidyl aminopeptidase/acylaminoacyl peptidase